ncbi:hypothetical protein GHT06_014469 [Daphnia sinensis]|uniref:Uncharacterized protein n=1 Tax=Daphnia sinensis TaxID=1820382 RepID=A0AAD5LEI8_9CRUS|nr:hypothetical protein GHT06_005778 [Daphnia sinensis]KAI9560450.1 hypothetical protein GHT06_014469 [Daphnia sinensis]
MSLQDAECFLGRGRGESMDDTDYVVEELLDRRTPEIANDDGQPCSTVTSSSEAVETSSNSSLDLNVENVVLHLSPEPSSTTRTPPSSPTMSLRRALQSTSSTPQREQQSPIAGSSGNTAVTIKEKKKKKRNTAFLIRHKKCIICKVKGHTVSSCPIRNRNTEGPTIAPESPHLIHSM